MNKSELISEVSKETGINKNNVSIVLDSILQVVINELKKCGKVQLTGFGTFQTRTRKAINGRNPQTGEQMFIPAAIVPVFKTGKTLKDTIAKVEVEDYSKSI